MTDRTQPTERDRERAEEIFRLDPVDQTRAMMEALAEARAEGAREAYRECAYIADQYASCEGIAQRIAAAIRAREKEKADG